MTEKTGLEILVENLKNLGFHPEISVDNKTFVLLTKDRFVNTKYVLSQLSEDIYFLAYDSGISYPFSGIYTSIKTIDDTEYKAHKRSWIDNFLYFNRKKTGFEQIDKKLTIVSYSWKPSNGISVETVNLFLKLNEKNKPYSLIQKHNHLPMIKQFKDKKIIGIETNNWIYELVDLRYLIDLGQKLVQEFAKR